MAHALIGSMAFVMQPCDKNTQYFHFANQKSGKRAEGKCCSGLRLWNSLECFDRFDIEGPLPYYCDVTGKNHNQQWRLLEDGRIAHASYTSKQCVHLAETYGKLVPGPCDSNAAIFHKADSFLPP